MSIDFMPGTDRDCGLLEQGVLLVRPADGGGRRTLEDRAGNAVGFVLPRAGWWGRGGWTVHEAFDEPVVFRVRRLWTLWPRWLVLDADGEAVGVVGRRRGWDRWDRLLFRRRSAGRAFVTADGKPAAAWAPEAGGGRLTLRADDPFSRMLLLAAVLV